MSETITLEDLDEIDAYCTKAIDGPWFVGADKAEECGPHANSGLSLVDTGRSNDWTVARLCEWPTAEFIAQARTDLPRLSQALRALLDQQADLQGE